MIGGKRKLPAFISSMYQIPRVLINMQIPGPHSRSIKSLSWEWRVENMHFKQEPPGDFHHIEV
jgi:hypothetical protein